MPEPRSPAALAPVPRANPWLLGHERAEKQVARWIEQGRLGHALMICGPWGIGKATWAFRIARMLLRGFRPDAGRSSRPGGTVGEGEASGRLLLPAPEEDQAPPVLSSEAEDQTFRWVASSGHPDLLTVERRFDDKRGRQLSEIVVDDIRKIGSFLNSSPALGGWRVVVVDAADEMNRNAANALLKVLEEPGAQSLIILVAHQPALLPATVRSRCRRVVLQPLEPAVLDQLMLRYQPALGESERRILAALAEGSIGRALDLASADGLSVWRNLAGLFTSLAGGDDRPLLAYASDPPGGGDAEGYSVVTHLLCWWLRTVVRAAATRACAASPAVTLPDRGDDAAAVQQLASAAPLDRWLEVWDNTTRLTSQAAAGNLDRKQALTTVLLDLRREVLPVTV